VPTQHREGSLIVRLSHFREHYCSDGYLIGPAFGSACVLVAPDRFNNGQTLEVGRPSEIFAGRAQVETLGWVRQSIASGQRGS
jgi:hypothetical protein